ncbi:TonB-dependent receptor [Parahaliea maris]|uniref:TonB-dependent receptor n=1 Tax=Parahaliea maris TaxID=2716870 RepID=A0A5C9A8S0_9GAMM|nr:TonB-dependent receptor [Parahaliea maris]TXS95967.1 TonB-dependent receptor [Parahaliea maris]
MRTHNRTSVLGLAVATAIPLLSNASVSQAQTGVSRGGLEEVIVSARRVEETLQEVPASVSVLTEDALRRTGVTSVEGVVGLTPGVTIVTNSTEVGDTQINIRGINGARDAENNVALVVDGILKTNTAQIAQIHGSLVQTEVMKGPQGAYYGRNAAAGAVILTTRKPGEEFSGDVAVKAGQQNHLGVTAVIDGPLSDNAGFVLYGDHYESDGYYRNRSPVPTARGNTVDARDNDTLGARLVFTPTDTLELDVKARYSEYEGSALTFNPVFSLPGFAAALGDPLFDEDVNDHNYDFIGNIKPENTQETTEFSVKGTWDLDDYTVTAWGLYSDVEQAWIADSTAASFYRFELQPSCRQTAVEIFNSGYLLPSPQVLLPDPFSSVYGPFGPTTCDGTQYQARAQEDLSAEVRIASDYDGPLNWSAGAYYLNLERETSVSIAEDQGQGAILQPYNPPESINPTSLMFADRFDTDVYAVFGSLDYDISERLDLSFALRYDREEREVSSRVPNVLDPATGAPINPGLPAEGTIPDAGNTYSKWQPRVSLNYMLSDTWNTYASWGVGFKAGGFNNQGSRQILEENYNIPLGSGLDITDEYGEETSSAFELGAKGTLADGLVTLDIAAYYTEVDDMQFFEFFTGSFGLLRVVSNIDKVEIYGVETTINAALTDNFSVFGSAAVNDSEIIDNSARPGTEGNKSPYTADYTFNVGAQYILPLGDDMELSLRADWRVTGPTWFHTVQENEIRTSFDLFYPGLGFADYSKSERDAYDTLDLRIMLAAHDSWRITAYGTNVLDEDIVAEVIPAVEFGGSFVSPGARRTFGVELGYQF